jgi:chromosome segregation ATPase
MSWLHNTTVDPSTAPLLAEIARLQAQLDHANESIDEKLDHLQENGLGIVGLTRKLQDAKDKIAALEDEIARLTRREERRQRRLARVRCQKCLTKVNLQGLDADER